ncbi:hypothetical protein DN050_03475 [Heyndrickxia coagulans]|nr:hypothetical protein C3766_08950 [Heyndrickxia coagulans]RCS32403.1 hypothetical protein DN050_03475 [Heyndrickxia coagulans]
MFAFGKMQATSAENFTEKSAGNMDRKTGISTVFSIVTIACVRLRTPDLQHTQVSGFLSETGGCRTVC